MLASTRISLIPNDDGLAPLIESDLSDEAGTFQQEISSTSDSKQRKCPPNSDDCKDDAFSQSTTNAVSAFGPNSTGTTAGTSDTATYSDESTWKSSAGVQKYDSVFRPRHALFAIGWF